MAKRDGRLCFDFDGTSPQTNTAVNFYLSPTMFKMFVGYYLLAVFDPHCTVNEGLYDAVAVAVPPDVQVPLAEQAAAAGRHLLLEKPTGLSLPVADRLAAICAEQMGLGVLKKKKLLRESKGPEL